MTKNLLHALLWQYRFFSRHQACSILPDCARKAICVGYDHFFFRSNTKPPWSDPRARSPACPPFSRVQFQAGAWQYRLHPGEAGAPPMPGGGRHVSRRARHGQITSSRVPAPRRTTRPSGPTLQSRRARRQRWTRPGAPIATFRPSKLGQRAPSPNFQPPQAPRRPIARRKLSFAPLAASERAHQHGSR